MEKRYVILSILLLMVVWICAMDLDGLWALMISLVSLFYAIFANRRDILIQDSYEVTQDNSKSYFTGKYYYFGKNLDSYVLLFKGFVKFGVLTVWYAGVSSLFLWLNELRFTASFSIIYFVCVVVLLKRTVCWIQQTNPEFNQTLVEAQVAIGLTSCSFISYFLIMAYIPDFGFVVARIFLLVFLCFACYIVPVGYYYYELNEMIEYKVKIHGDEIFLFQFKTVDGEMWKLGKDFDFLVIRDSGDYYLFLPNKKWKLVKRNEIENFGYSVKR